MAHIKLPYGEIVELSPAKAEGIKRALLDKDQKDRLIDLGSRTIKLSQVKEVDTSEVSAHPSENKEKYDIFRDREFLTMFGNEVERYGGFEAYCLEKQLLIPSRAGFGIKAVNFDKHPEYTDACEKWSAVKKLRDLSITPEERQQGIEILKGILQLKKIIKVAK